MNYKGEFPQYVAGNFAPLGGHLPPLRVARLAVEGAALMDWTGTVKRVSRIAEEFHLVSNSSESSTEYRCKFSLKSALQYEIAFNLTVYVNYNANSY
jgi:hypothetical protein